MSQEQMPEGDEQFIKEGLLQAQDYANQVPALQIVQVSRGIRALERYASLPQREQAAFEAGYITLRRTMPRY